MKAIVPSTMKTPKLLCAMAVGLALSLVPVQSALVTISDNPAAWTGYMNVFDLGPGNSQGGYIFGSAWGVPDLRATAGSGTLVLAPNTNGYEDNVDGFWRSDGGAGLLGNKFMDAATYILANDLVGQDITFTFNVDSFTLGEHTVTAFIRMFDVNFGVISDVTLPVTGVGTHTLFAGADLTGALGVVNLQYGFNTMGINSSLANLDSYGQVAMSAIPEPSHVALMLAGVSALAITLRRRK